MRTKSIIILIILFSIYTFAQKQTKTNIEKYTGKVVIFYGPNQAEYDSLAKDEDSGISEVIGDFHYYANEIEKYLKPKRIKLVVTSAQIIIVNYSTKVLKFDRSKSKDIVGVILSDGNQEPQILSGVMTDEDLKPDIVAFYKLK